jgi:transcriptional regulator with XRE-family HTH domain
MSENRIQLLRKMRGLTIEQLAEKASCSPQQISKLERGERRLSDVWLKRLALALNIAPWEIIVDPTQIAPSPLKPEESEILEIYHQLDDVHKQQAYRILKALKPIDT